MMFMLGDEAAENAMSCVLEAVRGERVAIICDDNKLDVGHSFSKGALGLGLWTRLVVLDTSGPFRKRVPSHLLEILSGQKPDLYINLLRGVGEETPFRIKLIHLETRGKKARLGHCPGVNLEMLTNGALAMSVKEHKSMQHFARSLIGNLGQTIRVEVTSPSGTDLTFSTEGRPFFTDTIVDWKEMKWMNLPTGEVIVAPVENSLEGKLVCNLAVGGIGPLEKPVELSVERGAVTAIVAESGEVKARVKKALETDEWAKVVGEFALGINRKARLKEEFLEAEKVLGTTHVAFGNNLDMTGGKNPSSNHTDFLFSNPTVRAMKKSGETIVILKDGEFIK